MYQINRADDPYSPNFLYLFPSQHQHCHLVNLIHVIEALEDLPSVLSASLEFRTELEFSLYFRGGIKRTFDMDQMSLAWVDTHNVQLALKTTLRTWPHLHRNAHKILVMLQPFGDQLL